MSDAANTNNENVKVFDIVTTTRITVPAGTSVERLKGGDGALVLPCGTRIKSFVVFERDEDEDLTTEQLTQLGCDANDLSREITESE